LRSDRSPPTRQEAVIRRLAALSFAPLALAAVTGCGSSSASAGQSNAPSGTITAKLSEYAIAATPGKAVAGPVTFKVTNAGQQKHEFVVIRTPKQAGALASGPEASETGKVGEVADMAPGASKTLKLKLKPGHYAMICNLPGHYTGGMHSDLTVQ
jgi:uncharacterized cupredoxin-like copper-binding protein